MENAIRDLPNENLVSVDKYGWIKDFNEGSADRVSSSNITNNVVTHNHPNDYYLPKGIAARIGDSLSDIDIVSAMEQNAAGIRVVTDSYTFNIKRPKSGWPSVGSEDIINTYINYFQRTAEYYRKYIESSENNTIKKLRMDRLKTLAIHKAVGGISKEYNLKYTRKRTR